MFENNDFNGKGKKIFPNGDYYEGNFINGSFNGYGIYFKLNGGRFEG
jgi:hypothetical protein